MARFNRLSHDDRPDCVNHAGGDAYAQSDRFALASLLLTSFVDAQYYRSAGEAVTELAGLVRRVDPLFAAKAAVYARREFGMRSVTHVVAGELAGLVKGEEWTKRFFDAVVVRPDDVTEILGYYASCRGLHPLPNSLKKGLALALRRFDDYELAKYRGARRSISLIDAVNLCHPSPTGPLTRLMRGALSPADTWEVALTQAGQQARDAAELAALTRSAWRRLLSENRLGYFAMLRNLRSIINTFDVDCIAMAETKLVDREAIRASRVFPFRIQKALDQVASIAPRSVIAALEEAIEAAFANVPVLPGRTLVAVDCSGSMICGGTVSPLEKAILFAAAIVKRSDCAAMLFSTDARYADVTPAASLAAIDEQLRSQVRSAGTNFPAIFDAADETYDRVIILSDMQAWMPDGCFHSDPGPALARYRLRTGADPAVYCFDLAGYGTAQFPARKVYQLAGFSEKVFDLLPRLDDDREALLHAVEESSF